MKRNIFILHHYATPPTMTGLTRPYDFSKNLIKAGYNPTVFASAFLHYSHEDILDGHKLYREDLSSGVPFVFVKTTPYSGNGLSRIFNMTSFFFNVIRSALKYAKTHDKPDIIYASSPHLLTLLSGIILAKIYRVECICEVRDLWPESIVAYSDQFTRKNPIIRFLYLLEKWIYRHADKLIFTMEGGYDYIVERGWDKKIPRDKVFHINNGVDLAAFDENREKNVIYDADLDNPETFKVIYTGAIRRANRVELILDAAKKVSNPHIRFLLWGRGTDVELIKQRIAGENITNVVYKGSVDKQHIPFILSRGDLNLLCYEESSVHKYGGSQNKMFEYMAAGHPVISNIRQGYDLIGKYGFGHCVVNGDDRDMADAISRFADLPEAEYSGMCQNARRAAVDYDFKNLTSKLIDVIEKGPCQGGKHGVH